VHRVSITQSECGQPAVISECHLGWTGVVARGHLLVPKLLPLTRTRRQAGRFSAWGFEAFGG
jgi:hypothetical protein